MLLSSFGASSGAAWLVDLDRKHDYDFLVADDDLESRQGIPPVQFTTIKS